MNDGAPKMFGQSEAGHCVSSLLPDALLLSESEGNRAFDSKIFLGILVLYGQVADTAGVFASNRYVTEDRIT